MEKFTTLSSLVAPFSLKDVDTDMIIPAQYLTSVSTAGYGEHLFERLRQSDQKFFMNDSRFTAARILAVGENFGCGSSREHAVWALMSAGFRVVLGSSFADIFSGNSAKSGLLLVKLQPSEIDEILKESVSATLTATVNLEQQSVTSSAGREYRFEYDPFRKDCLLNGYDDLDYLLSHKKTIEEHFSAMPPVRL